MAGSRLIEVITSIDPVQRNQSLDVICASLNREALEHECVALDAFWRESENLYERVRALFFLYSIYRFHLPAYLNEGVHGLIPFRGYEHLLSRRFVEAIDAFLYEQERVGLSDNLSSALGRSYYQLALQNLADQVHRSVQSTRGNQWMFRMGHPDDHPLSVVPELINRQGLHPVLREQTAVRMDLSHSCWSDIFFLGMDFPEGARVLNVSIDLAVAGRDPKPRPPVEASLRVIDEPVIRLASVDLGVKVDVATVEDVFNFAKDYLGLLKAAVIASGIVPMGIEGSGQSLPDLLERVVGPERGLELVSNVRGIPKGSRLAVSTNLLGAMISVCMRATGQTSSLTGPLAERDRRLVQRLPFEQLHHLVRLPLGGPNGDHLGVQRDRGLGHGGGQRRGRGRVHRRAPPGCGALCLAECEGRRGPQWHRRLQGGLPPTGLPVQVSGR